MTRGDITAGINGQGVLHYGSAPQNFSEAVVIGEALVKPGQAVKAGDKLVMADEGKLSEAIEAAQNELEKARIALKQAQSAKTLGELNAQKEAASQAVGSAEADGQLAQANSAVDSCGSKSMRSLRRSAKPMRSSPPCPRAARRPRNSILGARPSRPSLTPPSKSSKAHN